MFKRIIALLLTLFIAGTACIDCYAAEAEKKEEKSDK